MLGNVVGNSRSLTTCPEESDTGANEWATSRDEEGSDEWGQIHKIFVQNYQQGNGPAFDAAIEIRCLLASQFRLARDECGLHKILVRTGSA